MSFKELLKKYRTKAKTKVGLDSSFERVIKRYLLNEPIFAAKFEKIWLWNKFPGRDSISLVQISVSILLSWLRAVIIERFSASATTRINQINKKDIDTFITNSGVDFLI